MGSDAQATELDALREERDRVAHERDRYKELYVATLEQCKKLERGILASRKSERLGESEFQLTFAVLGTLLAAHAPEPEKALDSSPSTSERRSPKKRRKPTGRKPLSESLPRVDIEVIPEDVQREGLDAFERIGEDVSEGCYRALCTSLRRVGLGRRRSGNSPSEHIGVRHTDLEVQPRQEARVGLLRFLDL